MIKISCSRLEDVRNNPSQFVQQLVQEKKISGGSYGMLACWQNQVKAIHSDDISVNESIKSLQQRFMQYADNSANRKKQEFLIDRLKPYIEDFNSKDLTYIGPKSISWKIIPDVALTGYTPILTRRDDNFLCYFFSDTNNHWKGQLKFPLLQYYLAKNIFDCKVENIEIGYYNLSMTKFDLKSYTIDEIESAIEETKSIFINVNSEYKKQLTVS